MLLADALQGLPEDYREVIILRQLEGLSFPDVARRTGRTEDSVKNVWLRALARLRALAGGPAMNSATTTSAGMTRVEWEDEGDTKVFSGAKAHLPGSGRLAGPAPTDASPGHRCRSLGGLHAE